MYCNSHLCSDKVSKRRCTVDSRRNLAQCRNLGRSFNIIWHCSSKTHTTISARAKQLYPVSQKSSNASKTYSQLTSGMLFKNENHVGVVIVELKSLLFKFLYYGQINGLFTDKSHIKVHT